VHTWWLHTRPHPTVSVKNFWTSSSSRSGQQWFRVPRPANRGLFCQTLCFCSDIVGNLVAVRQLRIFRGNAIVRGAGQRGVLLASTQAEHRSPTQNCAIRCLWRVHQCHVTCWNVRVWKYWATFHQGQAWACSWGLCLRPRGLNHYPELHPLVSGFKEPSREANRAGFGFCSRAM
jgi:hypothetical protein